MEKEFKEVNFDESLAYWNEKDDTDGVFIFKPLPKSVEKTLIKECKLKRTRNVKNYEDRFDTEKMARKRIAYSLTGFEKVTIKTMSRALSKESRPEWTEKLKAEKKIVKFSEYWKNQLIMNHSDGFYLLYADTIQEIEELESKAFEDSLKN